MSRSILSDSSAAGLAAELEQSPLPGGEFGPGEFEGKTCDQELGLKLATLQREYADLHAGMFEASQVHRRLCAPRLVRHGDFEIASETFAARHLPGDFIAIKDTGEAAGGSALLALGDITGKGLAAGMWTTLLLGLLGIHSEVSAEPETIVAAMNRDLCRASIGASLTSFFLARLNSDSGKVDYCSAGHPPALLLGEDGRLELLSDGGPLLGAFSGASFAKGSVELGSGDVLVAYSDGILEAHNYADQEFGFDQLERQVRRAQGGSADAILFSVLGAVQDFVGGCQQADDISFVVVRRRAS